MKKKEYKFNIWTGIHFLHIRLENGDYINAYITIYVDRNPILLNWRIKRAKKKLIAQDNKLRNKNFK